MQTQQSPMKSRYATAIEEGSLLGIRRTMRERFDLIIRRYFETGAFYIGQIETGLLRDNGALVAENTAPLKSASLALGAHRVALLAGRIDASLRKGKDMKKLFPLLLQLKTAFHDARGELHKKLSY